jgi:GNAT superfamily N-acetyltransferase
MKELFVREAHQEELRETVIIYLESHQVDFPFLPPDWAHKDEEAELSECCEWLYEDPFNKIFVAFEGEKMAGYIACSKNVVEPLEYDSEINGFFVRHAYRGRGVGLKLLEVAGQYLADKGGQKVLVYTLKRGESDQFYRRLGGKLLVEVTQTFAGQPETLDVFGWQIQELLETVQIKLARHQAAI